MLKKVILTVENEIGICQKNVFADRATCLVGRAAECAWKMTCPTVSRRHCILEVDPPFVTVRDLHSLNGTYVNGERIDEEYDLADGDEVRIGDMKLVVHMEQEESELEVSQELESVS